jgi:putative transcriptional regulator
MRKPDKFKAKRADAGRDQGPARSVAAAAHHAVAIADLDAQPITADDIASGRVRIVPRVRTLRHLLRLSQEEFAARFHIPVGTLRDWEQRRKEPDAAAKAYLRVIALEPEVVRKALAKRPPHRKA